MKIVKVTNKVKGKEFNQEMETFYLIKRSGLFSHSVLWISDGVAIPVVKLGSVKDDQAVDPETDMETLQEKADAIRDANREDGIK